MGIASSLVRVAIAGIVILAMSVLSVYGGAVRWTAAMDKQTISSAAMTNNGTNSDSSNSPGNDLTMAAEPAVANFDLRAGSAKSPETRLNVVRPAITASSPPAAVPAPLPTPAWSTAVLLIACFICVRWFKRKLA